MRNTQNVKYLAKTKLECNEELRTIIYQVTVVSDQIITSVCFPKIISHSVQRESSFAPQKCLPIVNQIRGVKKKRGMQSVKDTMLPHL